jgi:hypothetical protein
MSELIDGGFAQVATVLTFLANRQSDVDCVRAPWLSKAADRTGLVIDCVN